MLFLPHKGEKGNNSHLKVCFKNDYIWNFSEVEQQQCVGITGCVWMWCELQGNIIKNFHCWVKIGKYIWEGTYVCTYMCSMQLYRCRCV